MELPTCGGGVTLVRLAGTGAARRGWAKVVKTAGVRDCRTGSRDATATGPRRASRYSASAVPVSAAVKGQKRVATRDARDEGGSRTHELAVKGDRGRGALRDAMPVVRVAALCSLCSLSAREG